MSGSRSLEELSHPSYWDNRYAGKFDPETEEIIPPLEERNDAENAAAKKEIESFEWFKDFESLKPFFRKHLPNAEAKEGQELGPRVLHLGCGNSVCI